jgi:hypothetical protein
MKPEQIWSNKRVVIVLGMTRSAKECWQDSDVTFKINRELMRLLNYPWSGDEVVEKMRLHHHALNNFKKFAIRLVGERLARHSFWGFKDTNTTVLLPFWQSVFNEAQVEDCYVIALRNPLGCAYSNIKHSHLELEGGLLAWLKNIILAVDGSLGKKRVVVSYESLLENPLNELLRMRRDLSIYVASQQDMEEYVKYVVDKKLHHHVYSDDDLVNHAAVAALPLCLRVYYLMKQLADDTLSFTADTFCSEWRAIKVEFDKQYPLYHYAHTLQMENKQLERELRGIRKALPWKLFSPLWWLDNFLRGRRKLGRQYKRLAKAYE